MHSYQNSVLRRTLPLATFNRLRTVFGQMAQRVGEGTLLFTEDVLSSLKIPPQQLEERFTVLVSKPFSALLLGTAQHPQGSGWKDPETKLYEVGLTFAPEAISAFLDRLAKRVENSHFAVQRLKLASQILQPNDANLQSEFTLSLVEILSGQSNQNLTLTTDDTFVSVCQPIHDALQQQVEQERLLNQVTTQIRQSLELPVILKTAVEQVRVFLQADRLVIYQFEGLEKHKNSLNSGILRADLIIENPQDKSSLNTAGLASNVQTERSNNSLSEQPLTQTHKESKHRFVGGRVTYEAKASDAISTVLHVAEDESCFVNVPDIQDKYRKGIAIAVEDVESAYVFSPCLLKLLRRIEVRSKLVVPILVQEKLWGLLIAHQCFEPRQWLENEKNFLRQIAEHLAIAIYQAQLYAEVQEQKETLEQRVIERTQELHDAMLLAQSASRAKSEFLATMSHELRTPLTCVIGLSSTLLRWSFGQLSQKQQHYLQTIHDSGEHLLELINDILELSHLEAGKTVLNISEFSLSQLAHQEIGNLKEKATKRGVELAIAIRLEAHQDRFLADVRRVGQIIYNLLSNGIKFTPEGGRVILRVWMEGNRAVFEVEDTGIGIPEHQQHLLFQKFQQLDSSYRRQYEGTGLGLALTKQLVELHGGRIEVKSEVDVGSTFTVSLPKQQSFVPTNKTDAMRSQNEQPTAISLPSLDFPAGSIVLIENHEETATLICEILTVAGFQVVWIVEDSNALNQIEILQPLMVILDIQLLGINGQQIMQQIRNLPGMQNLKILALLAKDNPIDAASVASVGADNYVTKPVSPQQLLQKVLLLIGDR